jgi:hypothetical protein
LRFEKEQALLQQAVAAIGEDTGLLLDFAAFGTVQKDFGRTDNPRAAAVIYDLQGTLYLKQKKSRSRGTIQRSAVDRPRVAPRILCPGPAVSVRKEENRAIERFNAALVQNPDQASPHTLLGMIYDSKGDPVLMEKH